ncbi:helix-turn-helix domain-containing protein [Staphylococcus equorum]|uniref:helix-turn-helix domain-containing protein n=1 Tax=Staphylococcus equorum TaxID=246432 RepID=UPI002555CE4E|nr:helix-turn-helix transcriptional regulator [Staphylococcus equorum]MDK9858354.1 helix-turn-helix transcriptional regulator [Staphylococcus equorum]MDK9875419.1 helix-turn-helix transcriptional regulator [Staphylococcus equorum]
MIVSVDIPELRGLIAKNGHSLRSFSKESDISISYLSLIVNKKTLPSPKMAKKISDSLNVPISRIVTFEDEVKI